MSEFNLKTGDILLCDYEGNNIFFYYFTKLIQRFTNNKFSHVSMVIKDPTYIHPSLKGYYVWQSSWTGGKDPQDNKIKLGVQLTPFYDVYNYYKKNNSHISLRRIHCKTSTFNDDELKKIHDVVYDKPYDIVPEDWIQAIFRKDNEPQKTDRFWCSALIGYIYTQCGLLPDKIDWSILRPSDFSEKSDLQLINSAYLSNEEILL